MVNFGVKTAGIMAVRRTLYVNGGAMTAGELSKVTRYSENAVRRWCRDDPNIINIGTGGTALWVLSSDAPSPYMTGFDPLENE